MRKGFTVLAAAVLIGLAILPSTAGAQGPSVVPQDTFTWLTKLDKLLNRTIRGVKDRDLGAPLETPLR